MHRMSDDVLEAYIKQYCRSQRTKELNFSWQGGEPTLMGVSFFEKAVAFQKQYAQGRIVHNGIQTNGVLLDEKWCDFFVREHFLVGLSLDGPQSIHDKFRVDRGGKPTFKRVMKALDLLKLHSIEFNTLTSVTRQSAPHAVKIYEFLKQCGSTFVQFIPIVERKPDTKALEHGYSLSFPPELTKGQENKKVMPWTVQPEQYGQFLIDIFDQWVRKDVGRVFVQIFDAMLYAWMNRPPPLCVFSKKCGNALVVEHTGDLYSCDHFVYPDYYLGNILNKPMNELVVQERQRKFGDDKLDTLTKQCQRCEVRFACNGDCPKHRFSQTDEGEQGLSWLCSGYKMFMKHISPDMQTMRMLLQQNRPAADIMQMLSSKVLDKRKK